MLFLPGMLFNKAIIDFFRGLQELYSLIFDLGDNQAVKLALQVLTPVFVAITKVEADR